MKKVILLALAALMMVGCEYRNVAEIEEAERLEGFNIVVIDSCEYLKKEVSSMSVGYGFMAHKGNCRFCEERDSIKWEKRRKELEELVFKLKEK